MKRIVAKTTRLVWVLTILLASIKLRAQQQNFPWPENKKAAISLTFDDARPSQVIAGTALLDSLGTKVTFYVLPGPVREHIEGWKKAVVSGHEIGNHSLYHPCSGNFEWSRDHALEGYSLDSLERELAAANKMISEMLGTEPTQFAYPCGQKFVGRGTGTRSYVPVIARMFVTGRGFMEETANDPLFADFAQITGIDMDGKKFEDLLPILKEAVAKGQWVVLAGHEMGESGPQTTRLNMLRQLISYCNNPRNQIWMATVGEIANYIKQQTR
jgi:peptidoglycan/xylan/chitin deacetylase (PgdA/CDA1 family)